MPSPVNLNLASWRRNLGRGLARWWPARCLVCREPCGPSTGVAALETIDLCRHCAHDLPWNLCACPRCGIPLPLPAPACGPCLRRSPPQTETRAVFVYAPPLDRLLPRLKFHDDLAAGRLLAWLMARALADAPRPEAVIALPLHRSRLRRRGYDQALELARPLARSLGLPLCEGALVRVRATLPQSQLDANARRRNLKGAFQVRCGAPLPAHVALVDDVMTTGASLHAATETLLRAGVSRVDAWVCARVA